MQLGLDSHDRTTLYADLRDDEALTPALRERALIRARTLGAKHVEFWRSPYGESDSPMAGFVELTVVSVAKGNDHALPAAQEFAP